MPKQPPPFDDGLAYARELVDQMKADPEYPEKFLQEMWRNLSPPYSQPAREALRRFAAADPVLNIIEISAWARAGWDDAELFLIDLIAEYFERRERLPDTLAAYNMELLYRIYNRRRRR